MVCAFAGHRPQRLPWGTDESTAACAALKLKLARRARQAYALGCRRFLCGMALGSDFYFCEAVLALRAACGDVTLEAVIPCPSQPDGWPEACRTRYYTLLAACDRRTVLESRYSDGCMLRRNRWMIDRTDCLITVYDGGAGSGTGAAVAYARAQGVRILPVWV